MPPDSSDESMTDQFWSAEAIVKLAFCQSFEAGNEQITEQIAHLEQLCQRICDYFCGHTKAERAIAAIRQGQGTELTRLAVYLQDAMEDCPSFAAALQELTQSIEVAKLRHGSRMEQTIQDNSKGYQTSIEDGKVYIGDGLCISDNSRIGSQTATVQGNIVNYNFFGQTQPSLLPVQYSSSNGSKPTPPHNIPRSDVMFVDRKPEVERLHQLLQQHDLVVITNGVNLDGLGKTELAIQYSRKHLTDYPGGICWLYPRQSDVGIQLVEFVRGWFTHAQISTTLTLTNQVIRCWQNWQEGQALLVVDDVTNYEKIKTYLPSDSRFKVLITAFSGAKLPIQRSQYLPLPGLPSDAALELLTALLGEEQVQEEFAFAQQLCAFVGYSPLGLHTVARCWKPEVSHAS